MRSALSVKVTKKFIVVSFSVFERNSISCGDTSLDHNYQFINLCIIDVRKKLSHNLAFKFTCSVEIHVLSIF